MLPDYLLRKLTGELEIVSGTEPFTVTPAAGDGDYDVFRLDNSAPVSVTGGDLTIPVLSGISAGVTGDSATLSWATNEGEGDAFWVCTTSATQPSPVQIAAGQDHTGGPGDAAGSQPVTTPGPQPDQAISGVPDGDYHFHLFQRDVAGNESAIASVPFTIDAVDTEAPVLSGVSASLAGSTATLRWSTNEAGGTTYWVCTTAATVPSATQIIAGQDHGGAAATASGAQVVSAAGPQPDQVVAGLATGPTYFFHLLHRDDNANTSGISTTGGVTVSAASAVINIVNRSALRIAPEALFFEVDVSGFLAQAPGGGTIYDPQYHNLHFKWTFDDPYLFAAPENMVPEHLDANVAYGKIASHTFRAAGTYTVTCEVTEPDSDRAATAVLDVVVDPLGSTFGNAATLFVDPDGSFDNAPTGARTYTDLRTALEAAVGAGPANPRRVMLNRGKTFPVSGQIWPLACPSLHVVAGPGTNPDPVIAWTPDAVGQSFLLLQNVDDRTDGNPAKSIVFQNVEVVADADPATATYTTATYLFNFGAYPPSHFLMDGCTVRNFTLGVFERGYNNGGNVQGALCQKTFNDCTISNWIASWCFELSQTYTVHTGCKIANTPDAVADIDGTANSVIAPYRGERNEHVIFDACDFFSSTGWSGTPSGTYKAIQPAVRFNTGANPGAKLNMQRCAAEAGFECLTLKQSNGENSVAINALVDKCTFLGNFMLWWFIDISYGGATFRNNLFIRPNTPQPAGNDPYFVTRLEFLGSDAQAFNAPVRFYNNTLVNLLETGNYTYSAGPLPWFNDAGLFATATATHNLEYQPGIPTPVTGDMPLDLTPIWTPRYDGYLGSTVSPKNLAVATPPASVATYAPLAGSAALGAAGDDTSAHDLAFDDFYGDPRPQYRSRGAFEMP